MAKFYDKTLEFPKDLLTNNLTDKLIVWKFW